MGDDIGDSDEALVHKIAAGDRSAEAALYERYGKSVYLMLRNRCKDPVTAEDHLQDTFNILIEKLRAKEILEPKALSGYVHKTAKYVWLGRLRTERSRQTETNSDVIDEAIDGSHSQLEDLMQQQAGNTVREMLSELRNDRDREILHRAYLLEHDKRRICHELELSEVHFDRVIYRAKARLKALIQTRLPDFWSDNFGQEP